MESLRCCLSHLYLVYFSFHIQTIKYIILQSVHLLGLMSELNSLTYLHCFYSSENFYLTCPLEFDFDYISAGVELVVGVEVVVEVALL